MIRSAPQEEFDSSVIDSSVIDSSVINETAVDGAVIDEALLDEAIIDSTFDQDADDSPIQAADPHIDDETPDA